MSHTRTTLSRRRLSGEAGVEIVEFALVFPLLLLVVLGIVDYGLMFQRYEVVTNAAREGARVAALPGYAQVDIEDRVTSFLAAGAVPTSAGNPAVTVTPTTIPNGAGAWPATTVRVSYDHDYLLSAGSSVGLVERLARVRWRHNRPCETRSTRRRRRASVSGSSKSEFG